jgi:hypothetical protein
MGEFALNTSPQPDDVNALPLHTAAISSELSFVEGIILKLSRERQLDIPDLPTDHKPTLGLLVGQVLAGHTKAKILNFKYLNPGMQPPLRVIPGIVSTQLNGLYGRGGGATESSDSIRRNNALKIQGELLKVALDGPNTTLYPEVTSADKLRRKWSDDGYTMASSSVTALLASYGARIGAFDRVLEQRTKDVKFSGIRQNQTRRSTFIVPEQDWTDQERKDYEQ